MAPKSELSVLYLRGVPRALVREAKVVAARQGRTLTALTCAALARTVSQGDAAQPEDPLARDVAWFDKHRAALLARHPGKYLAIVDQSVRDSDPDFSALATRIFAQLGPRPVFMPKLEARRVARLRSPRRLR
jgi:hypothetical protein